MAFATSKAIEIVNELMVELQPPVKEEVKYDAFKTDWNKLEPLELAKFLKEHLNGNPEATADIFQIFDVRDNTTDFLGGNILTALNVPCGDFCDNLHTLFKTFHRCKIVVIHCMYSQQRGIKSANWYRNALEEVVNQFKNPNIDKPEYSGHFKALYDLKVSEKMVDCLIEQKIFVLRGGFNYFLNQYYSDYPELFEGYDENYWSMQMDVRAGNMYSSRSKLVHIHDM